MVESRAMSSEFESSGSTSTAGRENCMHLRGMLTVRLGTFAGESGCPNPLSWAQAWASTCIGPSWKNWDMPSGNLTRTDLNAYAEKVVSMSTAREQPTPRPSSEPPALTGEKTEKKGWSSAANSEDIRSEIYDLFYSLPTIQRQFTAMHLKRLYPEYFAAPAETLRETSAETFLKRGSELSVPNVYKLPASTSLEILASPNGTLTLLLRPSASTER